jgi:penicillin-binding protein 1A
VIDGRNAFIMDSLMQDVTRVGTGARAASLGRKDIAGKTGTTNEFIDAWFAGYNPALVGVAWVGFDQPKTLGRNQTGGLVALPIWSGYMERALREVPEMQRTVPEGVVTADTFEIGLGTQSDVKHIPEYFYREFVPKDDSPPFTLLPGYVPPSEPPADAEKPWTPNY